MPVNDDSSSEDKDDISGREGDEEAMFSSGRPAGRGDIGDKGARTATAF